MHMRPARQRRPAQRLGCSGGWVMFGARRQRRRNQAPILTSIVARTERHRAAFEHEAQQSTEAHDELRGSVAAAVQRVSMLKLTDYIVK